MSDDVKIPLPSSLQEIVGSLLFASQDPLTIPDLREAVRAVEAEEGENKEVMEVYRTCTTKEVEAAVSGLEKALEVAGCGFRLVCTGGTYRMQTAPTCGRYVRAMLKLDRPNRMGRASLETLAIVAYRQPLTKSEIEQIRGVDVSANIKTLMDLQLIRLVGKSELPGHPFLYGTTPAFLEHFGLASLQQLNEIDPTLQRSNPKKKAEAYRKKEKPNSPENQAQEPSASAAPSAESAAEEPTPEKDESPKAGQEEPSMEADGEKAGDYDIFIDDTPNEFEDEDDGEEEELEDDEDGEDDDEEELEDDEDDEEELEDDDSEEDEDEEEDDEED